MSEKKDILCLQKMALNNAESHCTYKRMGQGGGEKGQAQRWVREEGENGEEKQEEKEAKEWNKIDVTKTKAALLRQ